MPEPITITAVVTGVLGTAFGILLGAFKTILDILKEFGVVGYGIVLMSILYADSKLNTNLIGGLFTLILKNTYLFPIEVTSLKLTMLVFAGWIVVILFKVKAFVK